MRKTIYLLNIGDYAPELTNLTYPSIYDYADKISAEVYVIGKRRFHKWPVTYEKLQIHELAGRREDDWALYIDSDTLIHPELPDVTELVARDTICHNALDWAPIRFKTDDAYFRRDARGIGSANWFAVASSWCLDLWRPLEMTPEEAIARIHPTVAESAYMKAEHLIDDYALSRNIARFGLKVTTLNQLWKDGGLFHPDAEGNIVGPEFFFHQYTMPLEEKIAKVKETMERWGI